MGHFSAHGVTDTPILSRLLSFSRGFRVSDPLIFLDFSCFSTENGVFRQPYKSTENRFSPSILRPRDGRNCGGLDPPVSTKSKVFLSRPFFTGGEGATRRASRGVPPLPSIGRRKKYRRSGVNPHCDVLTGHRQGIPWISVFNPPHYSFFKTLGIV